MNSKTPSLEELRIFDAVVRSQSMSRAAENLGVTTAYISKKLKQVETMLGVKLFHRSTRKLSLTETGETMAEAAARVLESTQSMLDAISAERSIPRGLLRVCSSSGFGRSQLAPLLSELSALYPELQFQLELLDRPVDLLLEGFHLDIRVGAVQEPELITRLIRPNKRVLCASPSYLAERGSPETLPDLADHNCLVIRERDHLPGRWDLVSKSRTATIKVNGSLTSNNGEVVRQWILDGHGIGLRSEWDIKPLLDAGKLVRVLPAYWQEANVMAVYPSRLASSARVRVCVEHLAHRLAHESLSADPIGAGTLR